MEISPIAWSNDPGSGADTGANPRRRARPRPPAEEAAAEPETGSPEPDQPPPHIVDVLG